MSDDYLTQGIAAAKAGKVQDARQLLSVAIKQSPNDERGWGWFYNVAANDVERLQCLKEVIRINPNNEKAKRLFQSLSDRQVGTIWENLPQVSRTDPTKQEDLKSVPAAQTNKKKSNLWVYVGGGITFLCVLAAVILLGTYFINSSHNLAASVPTQTLSSSSVVYVPVVATPTNTILPATPLASDTPGPSDTPYPTNPPPPTITLRPTNIPRPTSTPEYGTISNPFPYGVITNWWQKIENTTMDFSMQILEVIRGPVAWNKIYEANMFNDKPPAGMEYVLIEIEADHNGIDNGAIQVDKYDFAIVSQGQIFDSWDHLICCLKEVGMTDFDVNLMSGAKASGWLAFPVFIDDVQPLLIYGLKSDGTGGYYFNIMHP